MAGGKIASKLLDMASGARKARALEQGYDPSKIWYHGTPGDELEEFASDRVGSLHPDSFGYHFTNQKHEAGMYAGKGGTIGRYVTRAENPLVYDLDLYSPYSSAADKADSGRSHILQKIRDEADKGNIHDAVLIRRPLHEGAVNENLIMLDPEKIRSTKAAFDPDKRSSSKLLDSILMPAAGAGIAASALLAPEEAEASFVGEGAQGDSIRASDLPPLPTATQTIRHGFGRGADLGTITPMANPRMMGVANALDRASDATVPVLRPFIPFMESGADWARKAAQGHTSWWDKLLVGMDAI